MTDMETRLSRLERELQSLHIEQSAHNIVLTSINEAFEHALGVAQTLAVLLSKGVAPEHGVRVLEEIRSTVLGKGH